MYIVAVAKGSEFYPIQYGAATPKLEDATQLAKGLSAGIGRPGVQRGTILTVAGPLEPDAGVVSDMVCGLMQVWKDCVDVQGR
jgi:hypothetical protein